MKKIILLLLLAIAFIGCKKDPLYYPKPSPDIYQVISKVNSLGITLYAKYGTMGLQLNRDDKGEYKVKDFYKIKIECPSNDCKYYFNGQQFNESQEFGARDIR